MKHVPHDKYNVAWFTLAECIARGEKVRALGVYRLLSHSIEDQAFARQLEADILLAFADKDDALAKYKEAAWLYQKNGKQLEAIAVYEHMRDIDPEKFTFLTTLIDLYSMLRINSKVTSNLKLLCESQLRRQEFGAAEQTVQMLEDLVEGDQTADLHQQIAFALMNDPSHDQEKVLYHIDAAVNGFLKGETPMALHKFLTTLEVLNPDYAQHARQIVGPEHQL